MATLPLLARTHGGASAYTASPQCTVPVGATLGATTYTVLYTMYYCVCYCVYCRLRVSKELREEIWSKLTPMEMYAAIEVYNISGRKDVKTAVYPT